MVWQDWVISICQLILVIALIPTIRSAEKPPFSTCIMTAVLIGIVTFTFLTLHLWFSALTAGMASASWFLITYQKYRQKNRTT